MAARRRWGGAANCVSYHYTIFRSDLSIGSFNKIFPIIRCDFCAIFRYGVFAEGVLYYNHSKGMSRVEQAQILVPLLLKLLKKSLKKLLTNSRGCGIIKTLQENAKRFFEDFFTIGTRQCHMSDGFKSHAGTPAKRNEEIFKKPLDKPSRV